MGRASGPSTRWHGRRSAVRRTGGVVSSRQLGFIETSARNWQAALEHLRELAEIFARTEMVDLEALLWAVDYADAALQVGALSDVEVAISVLRRQGAAGRPEATVAADRCQALLTAARGDVDAALHELVGVVDQQGSECPFEAARSRLALGQVYRRAGYKGLASETLNDAAEAFEGLGIPRWAERARDEAGRAGLHPTTNRLTETERRVAELVGSGRSNQETAVELFISVKTVESNLTRIYRKLVRAVENRAGQPPESTRNRATPRLAAACCSTRSMGAGSCPLIGLSVRSDLDLSRAENLGGSQQRRPGLVGFPTACAGGPPVLEQLDLEVHEAEVITDPFHIRQAVGGLRGFEIVDGEADTGEAGGRHGLALARRSPGSDGDRARPCVTGVGPAGGQQLYGHRVIFHGVR